MIDVSTQLLIPDGGSNYRVWDLTPMLVAEEGLSLPPLNYLTQRGPYQHGDTVVGMRVEPRTIQVALTNTFVSNLDYRRSRDAWIVNTSPVNTGDLLAPTTPYIYRKVIRNRYKVQRADLVTLSGSAIVTSLTGRFVQWGLAAGQPFVITSGGDAGTYIIASVQNENTLTLSAALANDATGVTYECYTGIVIRDIDVFIEAGPALDVDKSIFTHSRKEVLRLVAHDPIWRDPFVQTITWVVDISGNLIFYESPNWTNRLVFPIWFSGNFVSADVTITYAGSWATRPKITLTGPFSVFKLSNVSTGDQLILNYLAAQGETIIIDLYALRAYNQFGIDLTNYLYNSGTQDSDLVTFSLLPHPMLVDGANQMHIDIMSALPNITSAVMTWQSRYIGV